MYIYNSWYEVHISIHVCAATNKSSLRAEKVRVGVGSQYDALSRGGVTFSARSEDLLVAR